MGLFSGNHTCPAPKDDVNLPNSEEPILGDVHFQHLLFWIGGGFTCVSIATCLLLAITHLSCYVRPREQRQIIRILFYPVIYGLCSCFSILDYPASLYLSPTADLYEPVALLSIFLLFVEFSNENPNMREQYFSNLEHKRKTGSQFKKGGWVAVPGGSLRWYQSKWVAVYSYFIVSVLCAIIQLITQAAGVFCEWSFKPAFAHFYIVIIENVVLPIGVLAVLQFYIRMNMEPHVKPHKPTLKIFAFKGIILLVFIQSIIFQILIGANVFKPHPKVTIQDQAIGIQQCLLCFDFMLVAIAFLFAYRASEYRALKKTTQARPMNIFLAAANALNPTDLFVGAAYAVRLLMSGVGPRGNGSWGRSGGYEKVRSGNSSNAPFDLSTPYTGGMSTIRTGRVSYQQPLTSNLGATPPAYDDTRPLRSPSPAGVSYASPRHGRSPSPSTQQYYQYSDAQNGSPPNRSNNGFLAPNPDYDSRRPSYEG